MKKEDYARHSDASKKVSEALVSLVNAVASSPKDANIFIKVKRKGGGAIKITAEYLSVYPFISRFDDYRYIKENYRDIRDEQLWKIPCISLQEE
jgi:hypothetical protein